MSHIMWGILILWAVVGFAGLLVFNKTVDRTLTTFGCVVLVVVGGPIVWSIFLVALVWAGIQRVWRASKATLVGLLFVKRP